MQDVLSVPVYVVTDPDKKPCAVLFSDNAARAWVRDCVINHHGTSAKFIGIFRGYPHNSLTLVYKTDDDVEVVYTIWPL